jgi:hypothetical protein
MYIYISSMDDLKPTKIPSPRRQAYVEAAYEGNTHIYALMTA